MLRSSKETKELFNNWATSYDEFLESASGPLLGYQESLDLVKEVASIKENARLLDVGIGTGALANLLSKEDTEVWGVDISEGMIEQCQEKHPQYHLQVGTFTEPNVEGPYDNIVSSFCFHEVNPSERKLALETVHKLLAKEGTLLILDIMFASKKAVEEGRQSVGKYWDETEDYPIVGELDSMLRNVNFKSIRWVQTGPYHWAVVARKSTLESGR